MKNNRLWELHKMKRFLVLFLEKKWIERSLCHISSFKHWEFKHKANKSITEEAIALETMPSFVE
ncbi:MAG: hypothetical protein SWX82_15100 [Cyanobacteriota bacterium]|nr:hypothetical protein [Cyanobacteriota bacterium]